MGIGINTGEVIAGNLGSRERTKYCVVGAAVNLASRVESYTLGGQILLSPETLREIEPLAQLEGNITVTPKGMAEPITLHQLGGLGGKHNLRLPSKEEQFLALPEEAPLRYHVLEGKHCREESFAGTLVKLSKESAQIRLEKALPRMTNIKLVLLTSDCKTVPGAIYAKVLGEEPEDPTCFRVGLTFVAPEAGKVLDMLRARD
jgi:adenylate cyclase